MAKSPEFDAIVKAYKDRYGVDLSHMTMHWSRHPVYTDGKRSYDFADDETGGSWVNDSTVRINPNMGPVMKRFGITGMTQSEFKKRLIAHELAHEIWRKQHDEKNDLINKMLTQAKSENFTTPYLPTVPKHKLDEETFAEYMSDQLNKTAQAYDKKKWPDYDAYQKRRHDKAVELARKLVEGHYKKQHAWGLKFDNGRFANSQDKIDDAMTHHAIIRGGKNILRQRRGVCHDLAAARLKLLGDNGIKARRLFVDYGDTPAMDGDHNLGHSMVYFNGDDGKLHIASPAMRDRPRKNFGSFDDLNDAVIQYIAALKDSKKLTDDDFVEIHDTTDVPFKDIETWDNYRKKALGGKLLYRQKAAEMKRNFKGLLKLSAWEDVPGTPLDASKPYVTKSGPKPGDPVVIPGTIKDFFNDIQFPTKQEFGGRPGIDYNDSKYRNGFWNDASIYYGDKDSEGITWPWGSLRIPLTENGQLDESTLVHELQHYMDRDSVPFVRSGRSSADNAKLQSGYAFDKSDMIGYIPGTKWYAKKIEPSSTNAEYRYKLYKQLLRENIKAGKGKPTYAQFKEYIRTLPADQLVQYYSSTPNMYAESLVNRQKQTLNATQPTLPKNLGSMPPAMRIRKKHEYMQKMREWNKRTNILNNLRRALIEVAQTRNPQGTAIV